MLNTIGAAMPLLLQARVLDATSRAQRTHGRPVTSAEILQAFDVPPARSSKGLTVLLAKVAMLLPDHLGRSLLDLGKDRTGTRTFLVDAPADSASTPGAAPPQPPVAPAGTALVVPQGLATRLQRLAGGELGAKLADVLATVLQTALDAVESRQPAAAPRAREPGTVVPVSVREPDPVPNEAGPAPKPPQDSPDATPQHSDQQSAALPAPELGLLEAAMARHRQPPAPPPASELADAQALEKLFSL